MFNLSTVIETSARDYGNKDAIVFGDKRFTYGQIHGMVNQLAHGLQKAGITKGDKVALTCPNLPYFPVAYYAILKLGATVVPLNILLKKDEIAYHLKDSGAKAYFCFQGTADLPMGEDGYGAFQEVSTCEKFWMITADPTAESPIAGTKTMMQIMAGNPAEFTSTTTSSDDTAVVLYTSGTTGKPKGAELSHNNIMMNMVVNQGLGRLEHEDIQLLVLPMFHSFGQTIQMNSGFYKGNTIVLIPRFEPTAVLSALEKENVTIFCGVPTMYWALLNVPDADKKFDLAKISKNLRLGVSGGASIPVELLKQFEAKFGVTILEGYGLSETSPLATFNALDRERKTGSIGQAVWGVEVDVFDENDQPVKTGEVGEIVIRGHNVMKGYLGKPEETAKAMRNGWFHSGDLAKKDEDGYFYIVDRLKDMVLRGGYNVYPREVEEVLLTHDQISLAAVIGVPHDVHGEEVKAFVIPKPGENLTSEALISWCKEKMASYKYPRIVEIRENLPMTATGKILKRELRKPEAGL